MGGSKGGRGGFDPPLKNHKNIWSLSNTGQDSLKNHKATKPAFTVGPLSDRQRNTVSLTGRWWPSQGIWILSSTKKKKTLSKLDPLWQNFLNPGMKLMVLNPYRIFGKSWFCQEIGRPQKSIQNYRALKKLIHQQWLLWIHLPSWMIQ